MIHDSWILYFNKRIGIILFILEQIQVVRRGSRFDPVKYVKEVVTRSIGMPIHFWSTQISLRN